MEKRAAKIRKAVVEDCEKVFGFIKSLASEEGKNAKVVSSVETLKTFGFGPKPAFSCLVFEVDGEVVGFAMYSFGFGSWVGRTVMIDDVYVEPSYRKLGLGTKAFQMIAEEALLEGCQRVEWFVYHQEMPKAAALYEKWGAHFEKGLWRCQLNGEKAIQGLAQIC